MIKIVELYPPRKISGLTSLAIDFDINNPYSQNMIDIIKTCPVYYFHTKDCLWEVPISSLSKILDALTFYDDISLTLANVQEVDEDKNNLTEEELNSFKLKPFPHQIDAINYGLNHPQYLLLDSMGLGKSCEIIWTAEILKKRGLIEHCLIICGINSLKQNWRKEIEKFSNESVIVIGAHVITRGKNKGSINYTKIKERAEQLQEKIEEFFVIINIESLRDKGILNAIKKSKNKFDMIAFDEAHKAATQSSLQSTNLLKLDAPYKIAATGTLLTNSPLSCFVPLKWTGRDNSILTTYKSLYCTFGGFNNAQVIGYHNLEVLKEELERCSIRRTLDQVRDSMPSKNIRVEYVEMEDDHRKFYEAIKSGVKEEADKIVLKTSNLLALTTRLRQATACPKALTTQKITSSKVERCMELIDELVGIGEKVVILATFKDTVAELAEKLKKLNSYKFSVNTGDTPDGIMSENVDRFQNNPEEMIFLGTFGKCSTGITLNAASYLIALDESWGAYQNSQAFDRIYRITNTRPANITILVCTDTIDERVHDVAQIKQDLSDYIVDNKEVPSISNNLSDKLREIIQNL